MKYSIGSVLAQKDLLPLFELKFYEEERFHVSEASYFQIMSEMGDSVRFIIGGRLLPDHPDNIIYGVFNQDLDGVIAYGSSDISNATVFTPDKCRPSYGRGISGDFFEMCLGEFENKYYRYESFILVCGEITRTYRKSLNENVLESK